jgi:hypothetical protein
VVDWLVLTLLSLGVVVPYVISVVREHRLERRTDTVADPPANDANRPTEGERHGDA